MTEDVAPKPTWQPLWLGCKACKHEWDDWLPSGVRLDVAIASLQSQRCPKCGLGMEELVIRSKPITPDTPKAQP